MDALILRLDDTDTARWCRATTPADVRHGPLHAAAADAAGRPLTVLVPASAVLLTSARVPSRRHAQVQQALPYALEEQLGTDVTELHFALGPRGAGDAVAAAVVARARMDQWRQALATAGLAPRHLLPEVLALPFAADAWTLLLEDRGFLLRTGPAQGHGLEMDALEHLLGQALAQAGEGRPRRLRCIDCRSERTALPVLADLCQTHGVELVEEPAPAQALTLLAAGAAPVSLDLLQGGYGPQEHWGRLWRPWRTAAALLALLLALQGGLAGYRYWQLSTEEADLAARIEQVYRSTFPEARRVVDARAQMEQRLTQLQQAGGGDEFQRLLTRSGSLLGQAPQLSLHALNYRPGVLELDLQAPDLSALDRLRQSFATAGLRAEIDTADSSGGQVRARLIVRGAAG